jgi:hypothetical protein
MYGDVDKEIFSIHFSIHYSFNEHAELAARQASSHKLPIANPDI